MPLTLDVPIALRIRERRGRDIEHAVVEHVENIGAREAAPRMPRARVLDDLQNPLAVAKGFEGELVVGEGHGLVQLEKQSNRERALRSARSSAQRAKSEKRGCERICFDVFRLETHFSKNMLRHW